MNANACKSGLIVVILLMVALSGCQQKTKEVRPNILLAISDDQSFPHTSIYGYQAVNTPAFDRVATEGVLFTQAFAASPGCSPSRAALLTGLNCWQLEEAGTHASYFPAKYITYPELLGQNGYHVGHTGKGWGPGNFKQGGRANNPAGKAWQEKTMESPEGIRNTDYASNFKDFLAAKKEGQPFCFWYGASEPHRVFKKGIGIENGKKLESVDVPGFLPDRDEIKSDILDYCTEIEWFDQHLSRIIDMLEEAGELDNTIIIVTSDNGMAFPRAKANVYEYGIHMPFAIRWGAKVKAGREIQDLVGFTDIAPTILEATGINPPQAYSLAGKSLMNILTSDGGGITEPSRDAVYSSRERHSSSRYRSLGYPQRALRTHDYLYIRNFKPERWPAGAPQKYGKGGYPKAEEVINKVLGPMHGGYPDIDPCPTLDFLIETRDDAEISHFLGLATDIRPGEELFDIKKDPSCLNNLAENPDFASVKAELAGRMKRYLTKTGDPRVTGNGDIWETYPRMSRLRKFQKPDWAQEHPDWVPDQPWVDTYWKKQTISQ